MNDYRGTPLKEGDKVAIYWGHNELVTAEVHKIQGNAAKVKVIQQSRAVISDPTKLSGYSVTYTPYEVISKWKRGECMVKLPD